MQGTVFDFFVQWHLTERCNLHCRHCYQDAAASFMTFPEIIRAIDSVDGTLKGWVTDHGMAMSPAFHFTGGEPLLHDHLFDILEYVGNLGYATAIMSNGTLVTPHAARRLHEARVGEVQVSFEGMEAVHDSIRGRGSFRRALAGVEALLANGVDTSINLTLSRLNIGEVDGLVGLAGDMGIGAVTFSRLVACGRGNEISDQMLTPPELAEFYRWVHERQATSKVTFTSLDPLFTVAGLKQDVPDSDFPIGGCAAGVFGITITADGNVMPCRRMDLSIGNIRDTSLRELWAESPVLWSLRNRGEYHGQCGSCYYWAICRGCRAIALASARTQGREDFLGPDPQCPSYRPVI
jgi:radical SAM protein with 4Fe4S-binding SPASM domain